MVLWRTLFLKSQSNDLIKLSYRVKEKRNAKSLSGIYDKRKYNTEYIFEGLMGLKKRSHLVHMPRV